VKSINHIGIIMDGNGRWAQARRRPRTYGHIKGATVAKNIISYCAENKIKFLTLYAFSTENWLRPKNEVTFLMMLLKRHLQKEVRSLVKQNIRFTVIGNLEQLPDDVVEIIKQTEQATNRNTGLNLTFAVNYGSRQEITNAAKEIAKRVLQNDLKLEEIDESCFNSALQTYPFPSPDLIIRTSGEYRLSNFMLWQSAYSELFFSDVLWPDFTRYDLEDILSSYLTRERRFGKIETVRSESINTRN
jgi:undecaprenyl diphosphate synthase